MLVSRRAIVAVANLTTRGRRVDFGGHIGAAEETRTPDPIITNDVLYQLSYSGTFLVWPLLWPY